jgi:RNA polymerase sigma-70 factor (ECF subfamily)
MERMGGIDAEVVARARAGDKDAFRVLVERHSRLVFGVAYRLTGNETDADDVVQETFLRAYRRLDQFEDRANFGSWLYRIAANCAYDLLRGRRRHEEHLESAADEDGEAIPHTVPSNDPQPDRVVFGREVRHRVDAALQRMSVLERSAFVLRHFEGMSIEEIGRALSLDTSATKHSIFRAVKKVRRALLPLVGAVS